MTKLEKWHPNLGSGEMEAMAEMFSRSKAPHTLLSGRGHGFIWDDVGAPAGPIQ